MARRTDFASWFWVLGAIIMAGAMLAVQSGAVDLLTNDVDPSLVNLTASAAVTLRGTGFFTQGETAPTALVGQIAAQDVVVVNSTTITCTLPAAGFGLYSLSVQNPDGQRSGALPFVRAPLQVAASVEAQTSLRGGGCAAGEGSLAAPLPIAMLAGALLLLRRRRVFEAS